MSPTSGTAIAAPPKIAGAEVSRKNGETNINPVACACAAEFSRTTDVLWLVAAKERAGNREPQRPRECDQPVAGEVHRPGAQAGARCGGSAGARAGR